MIENSVIPFLIRKVRQQPYPKQLVRVKIIEINSLEDCSDSHENIVFDESEELTFNPFRETFVKLPQPIRINPLFIYQISIQFSEQINLNLFDFKYDIEIGHGIVRFYDKSGPVTGLRFVSE